MNATTRPSLDSTFAIAVLVTGLVFGLLPATSSVDASRPEAAQRAEISQTDTGATKLTVTAAPART